MNTQDNFITAVNEAKHYVTNHQFLTDEQRVLLEGEIIQFLTCSYIKQVEAEKKEESFKDIFKNHREFIFRDVCQKQYEMIGYQVRQEETKIPVKGDIGKHQVSGVIKSQRDSVESKFQVNIESVLYLKELGTSINKLRLAAIKGEISAEEFMTHLKARCGAISTFSNLAITSRVIRISI